MNQALRPKVGLLALTLELYETLAPELRRNRETWVRTALVPELEQQVDILFERAVFSSAEIERAVDQFEAAQADALLVLFLSYSPSQVALPALKRTRLPLIVWNTQELRAVDPGYSLEDLFNNHGVHGTQDLASVLGRSGVPFGFVTSHLEDPGALEELNDFFIAAAAARRLRQARIGMLGYPFPGMGDFAVDTTHLLNTLGCTSSVLTVEDFIHRADAVSMNEARELVATYRESYAVAPAVSERDLISTACAELALRGQVRDHRLDAITYQFLAFGDDERSPTVPFVAASRLMADGVGFGGEGDLVGAAGNAVLEWIQPPASFAEIFTIDFGGNSLFMSHMGEANVAMARRDRKVPLVARPTPITRTRDGQLALVTSFEPGPATFFSLAGARGGRWRFLAAAVTIEDFGPLPALCVPHFKLKPAIDVRQFLTAYALGGGPHHNAVCFGDARPRLRQLAKILDAEYHEVGA